MAADAPIACTLSPTDYRARLAVIATLNREALLGVERRGLTLDLRYRPEASARVRDLVAREQVCCAFLTFEVRESADEVRLLVTAPAAAAEVLPELLLALAGRQQ